MALHDKAKDDFRTPNASRSIRNNFINTAPKSTQSVWSAKVLFRFHFNAASIFGKKLLSPISSSNFTFLNWAKTSF